MEIVSSYMTYGFDTRVRTTLPSSCLLHNLKLGLSKTADSSPVTSVCEDCKAVFFFFARFKELVKMKNLHAATIQAIDDFSEKAKLFLGHRIRTINHQLAIQTLVDNLRDECLQAQTTCEAIVTLDYKMKLDPLYFREKTVEHYGKRGISWHGSLVHYFEYDDGVSSGTGQPTAVDTKLYFDHFSVSDTKQDREAVVSVLEAVLIRLKRDLPQITRITLLSDNATCYQNWLIPLVAPYLSVKHGITVHRIIHTKTQDGKSILDAHFARAMQHLIEWVNEGNNCLTPTQAVIGLQSHGGLPNCISELVQQDRHILHDLVDEVADMEKDLRRIVSRANEVVMSWHADGVVTKPCSGYKSCPPFTLTAYVYSGIGNGAIILCSPLTHSCRLISVDGVDDRSIHCVPTENGETEFEEVDTCDITTEEIVVHNQTSEEISRIIGVELGSGDMEESDDENEFTETIEAEATTGSATGVKIFTQGQLRRRIRNWHTKPEENIPETTTIRSKDVVSYAVGVALDMRGAGRICIQSAAGNYDHSAQANMKDFNIPHSFSAGWAVSPAWGKMYGAKYIANFKSDIEKFFLQGMEGTSTKMGPGRMLERLKINHPDLVVFPGENEIRHEISKLQKRYAANSADPSARTNTNETPQRITMQDDEAHYIEQLLVVNHQTMPRDAVPLFRKQFPQSQLKDAQIRSKVSSLRAKGNTSSRANAPRTKMTDVEARFMDQLLLVNPLTMPRDTVALFRKKSPSHS